MVVVLDEFLEKRLQGLQCGGLVWLGAEPLLHRLLEAFDFARRGGMVRAAVPLNDVKASEFAFECVAAGPAGEPGGGGTSLHEVLGGKSDC